MTQSDSVAPAISRRICVVAVMRNYDDKNPLGWNVLSGLIVDESMIDLIYAPGLNK